MAKKKFLSRKRREQTIAIIIVMTVVLIVIAAILIFIASRNNHLGEHDHDHESEITLKVSVDAYEGEIHYNAAVKFEEQVESRTGGAVQVEVYPKGKLGDNHQLIHALEENAEVVDIIIAPVSDFVEADARMDMSTLPFMFADDDDAWNYMNGDIQKEIEASLLNKNIRVLTHYVGEMTCMLSADKAINTAEDMNSMTIALSEESNVKNAMHLMNANCVVLNGQSVYQNLLEKQCDAYMGTLRDIYNNRIYQKQGYLAVTYHTYEGLAFAISGTTWQELGEYQEVVEEIAKSSAYTDKDLVVQQEREMLEHIKSSGIRILYPDMRSFAEKAESYLRSTSSKYGMLIEEHIMHQRMKK